ncbi:MAG: adenylate cyclase, partial [Tardiphaga sp.]|nr:adenylate cyclase [Tardiphaga sp.]
GSWLGKRLLVFGRTLLAYLMLRYGISAGGFEPKVYIQQLVENSDFRKYDDGLRMILDCMPDLEHALQERLVAAAAAGTIRYGLHRQDAAMMTCFTPSALRSDHVHFIDGARGGYASAASALKAMNG